MRILQNTILAASIFILFNSCEKNKITPVEITSLTLSIGSEWNYLREATLTKFESETSDKVIDTQTLTADINITIEKDTVFNDSINRIVFCKHEKILMESSGLSTGSYFGYPDMYYYYYKFIDDEGLKNYAYRSPSSHKLKSGMNHEDAFIDVFSNYGIENILIRTADDIYIESTPPLEIKLPLNEKSGWTFREPNEITGLQINKKVIGYELVNVNGEDIFCYKIEWEYLNDTVFKGIQVQEWISEIGLIKSETIYDRVTLTTSEGEEWGNSQISEIIRLQDYSIK